MTRPKREPESDEDFKTATSSNSPSKKVKGENKASPKKWTETELETLWKGLHVLAKTNVGVLKALPGLEGRTTPNMHNKIDALFKGKPFGGGV